METMQQDLVLVKIDSARRLLAEAVTIQQTKRVVDMAHAAEVFARRQKMGAEAERHAVEIKMEALRQLGAMLKATERAKGTRGQLSGGSKVVPPDDAPTLADMGLDKKTSKLAQDVASLPDELFEKVKAGAARVSEAQQELRNETRKAERAKRDAELESPSLPTGRYGLVYVDPPWQYDFSKSDSREIENHYPTMDLEQICALPVADLFETDCVCFMWATSPKLADAMKVLEAWGLEYKTCMVWVKDKIGMGYYARQQHEILLIGTRGNPPVPEPQDRPSSVVNAPRGEHSAKPEEFYGLLESMYPYSRRVELFARNKRNGWDGWGNQA